jgi:hypothetical protein
MRGFHASLSGQRCTRQLQEFSMFSVRGFLRQIPVNLLKAFFESGHAPVPPEWWTHDESKLVVELADYLVSGRDKEGESILANFVRVQPMASERGRRALLNAAALRFDVVERFGQLGNDEERALWMLMTHPILFREGEELRFFDYYSEGRGGRHYKTAANKTVSRDEADVAAFKAELCQFHHRRDGSGISCEVEFAERHQDDTIQVAVYVQGLPNNGMEFVDGKHVRRISNPSLEAAIVYDPSSGNTSTVAKGGKEVHEALREAFARKLLKIEPKFDLVRKRNFQLESLKAPQALAADPELGVKAVRVRRLRLAPPGMNSGMLTIEAPAGVPGTSVYDLGNSWFTERASVYRKFTVAHAMISMHFNVEPDAKRAKTLNIELTLPNSSNLKDLPDADRKIAEAHINKWKLIEAA